MRLLYLLIFLFFSLHSYGQDINNGLILYLPFSGHANDLSGNNLNATVNGASLTMDGHGNPNSAYLFNASEQDYLHIPENTLLRPGKLSVSLCFKPDQGNTHFPLVYKGEMDTTAFQYSIDFYLDENSIPTFFTTVRSGTVCENLINPEEPVLFELYDIAYDEWHHVVISYDEGVLTMLVDGDLNAAATGPADGAIFDCPGGGLNIGVSPWVINSALTPLYYSGVMDEIRVYNRALDYQEMDLLNTCSSVTNIRSAMISDAFTVSPNPGNSGIYQLGASIELQSPEFSMVDYLGKKVPVEVVRQGKNYQIDISSQPRGIYYLMIKDGGKLANKKLVYQ